MLLRDGNFFTLLLPEAAYGDQAVVGGDHGTERLVD